MQYRRNAILSGAVALSSFFALGAGAAAASAADAASSSAGPRPVLVNTTQPTLHTATTQVGAMTETILVNAKGLPLYYYQADTAKKSQVSGVLARLWPAWSRPNPRHPGVKGKVVSLREPGGRQVAYNGHFLYTFVDDSPGHVTGQGVSNFFVATPNIRAIGSSTTVKTAPAPATPVTRIWLLITPNDVSENRRASSESTIAPTGTPPRAGAAARAGCQRRRDEAAGGGARLLRGGVSASHRGGVRGARPREAERT